MSPLKVFFESIGVLTTYNLDLTKALSKLGVNVYVDAECSLPRPIAVSELIQRGYAVYRYLLRGFILVRVDRGEVYTLPSRLWKALGFVAKLFHPMLKLLGVLERGYLLAYKAV
jgi:hypothetical protein